MSRAPRPVLLAALAFGVAVGPAAGWATPRYHGEDQADAAPQVLLLPKSTIKAAVRRTAVADPDLDGEVTDVEAARYYETRFALLDENRDGSLDGPEFVRAAAVRALYAVDGFAQPRPLAFEFGRRGWQRRAHPGGIPARRSAAAQRVHVWRRRRPPACPLRFRRRRSRRPAEPAGVHACRPPGLSSAATPTGTAA